MAPQRQFDFWREVNSGLVDYAAPADRPPAYDVHAATWKFGGLAMLVAKTPAGIYSRSLAQVRRDGIDHWSFTMARSGRRTYRTGDQVTAMRQGELYLHTLGQPFDAARTASSWLHLYVPRSDLGRAAATPRPGEVLALDTAGGRLLRDHLVLLAEELPRMTRADAERMAEATRALVALALAGGPERPEAATPALMAAQAMQVRAIVRAQLGSATLGPTRLCRMTGISRSQLYRLFAPHGGVALFIQRERLAAAFRALSDPADSRGVSEIGAAVGLFDASSFSRMFRRSFGLSPREVRDAARTGAAPRPAATLLGAGAPTSLRQLLLAI
ncbi:helix-turn-helix domain-containing protein [Falsiroseomonas oryziterrae]|uniref:helix-turn-helix domain-containing protein n=1 Tax=Falsiroseomonas oryziterrae TaxID=2911368 RepID=UPI001EFF6BF7|nr:helix-turn-helix domain-containing protein [Roseomonas sp. NPKOSM-4]